MRTVIFERISPKKKQGHGVPGTTFYVASMASTKRRAHGREPGASKLWDCRLTVLGEQFDFSCDPDLYEKVMTEAFDDILRGNESESRFHIPDFDAEVVLLSINSDSFGVVLRFGGKEVERCEADRSTLLGLLEKLRGK